MVMFIYRCQESSFRLPDVEGAGRNWPRMDRKDCIRESAQRFSRRNESVMGLIGSHTSAHIHIPVLMFTHCTSTTEEAAFAHFFSSDLSFYPLHE